MKLSLPVPKDGRTAIHLVALHRPDGAVVRAFLDGKPLPISGGEETFSLRSAHAPRNLNVNFKAVEAKAGTRELTLECIEPGVVGLDYLWTKQ